MYRFNFFFISTKQKTAAGLIHRKFGFSVRDGDNLLHSFMKLRANRDVHKSFLAEI